VIDIRIIKAVLHVLDQKANEPLLNEYEMEIDDELEAFIGKHIVRGVQDDDIRKAKFLGQKNVIKEEVNVIVANENYFLEGTWNIARKLFKAMKTHGSISSTDLLICIYENEEQMNLAILKLDYNTSFIHNIETIDNKFKITIKKQDISLPGPNQKLQKSVFIPFDFRDDYDMILLDNQVNSNSKEPIALFFLNDFLNAKTVNDSKSYTKTLKKETDTFINDKVKVGEEMPREAREQINRAIRVNEEINIEKLSNEVFANEPELKEEYINRLKESGIDKESFTVDKEWVGKRLNKIRLKVDDSIELTIPFDEYSDKDRFIIMEELDGTKSILIKRVWNYMEK
jgi:nucleoid-associated protein YejK